MEEEEGFSNVYGLFYDAQDRPEVTLCGWQDIFFFFFILRARDQIADHSGA